MSEERHDELLDLLTNEEFKKWILEPAYERQVFWEKWLEHHPEKRELVKTAAEFIKSAKFKTLRFSTEEKDQILSNIISYSQTGNRPSEKLADYTGKSRHRRSVPFSFMYRAAAVLAFIGIFSGLIYWNKPGDRSQGANNAITIIEKENPKGRKSVVMLPDGTRATLNSFSRLTYDSNYGSTGRIVNLEGEAFFEVTRDTLRPFQVISNEVVTTALGTSFDVRAFNGDDLQSISLLSGKVKVTRLDDQIAVKENILNPGEGFVIDNHSGVMEKITFDPLKVFGWKDGILVFRDNDLNEVIQTLERWYDIRITLVGTPAKSWRADGNFDNESLEGVLQGLSYTYDLEFLIKGKDVELKFN